MWKRIVCIGDVHGCLDELKELVEKVNYDPKWDRIIMVGDLVDRGPDSAGVVRYVRNMGFDCVAGNHDNKFGRYYGHEVRRAESLKKKGKPYKNPMRLKEDKRKVYDSLTDDERKWLADLPSFIYMSDWNTMVVHAGVQPGRDPLDQRSDVYRHCRYVNEKTFKLETLDTTTFAQPEGSRLWGELYTGKLSIVHGHHVGDMESPQVHNNSNGGRSVGIDTGCCFGGRLTAFVMTKDSETYVQVPAKKVHYVRHQSSR